MMTPDAFAAAYGAQDRGLSDWSRLRLALLEDGVRWRVSVALNRIIARAQDVLNDLISLDVFAAGHVVVTVERGAPSIEARILLLLP